MRSFLPMSACVLALALIVPPASTAAPTLPIAPSLGVPATPALSIAPLSQSAAPALPIATSDVAAVPSPDVAVRWAADDAPIANGDVSQSWTWGPQIFRSAQEPYAEAPGGNRNVWYLDKARMEITNPDADPEASWFVTSGLLVRELISGQMQMGDAAYESRTPAEVPIAGDLEAPLDQAITYADLKPLASLDNDRRAAVRTEFDTLVDETIGKGGVVQQDQRFHQYEVHLGAYDEVLGHNLPRVFTEALSSEQLLYVAGRPITEPYWTTVQINHEPRDVLVQAFERRVLTFTPSNPEGWRVEWGNVGRQYAQWRYGVAEDGAAFDPSSALDVKSTIRKLEELSPEAARIALQRKGLVGAAVLDITTGELYSITGTRAFPMYSTAKVPIMIGVLNKAIREKRGVASWEDGLLRAMIQRSDNAAATKLIVHIGGAAVLNRYLRGIGINNTQIDADNWGESTATPQDMARLLAKLANCTILNATFCHYALELMRNVTPGQRWGISAGVPGGVSVAVKNGWYPESEGWTINSVGYIKGNRKRYTIAVYTRPNQSMRYGIDTIEAISAQIYPAIP
ncbi:MAG TPA: serine hydrolase [Herpetosiphonaceae bacterium]